MSELGFRTSGRVRHRRGRGCFAVLAAVVVIGAAAAFVAVKGQSLLAGAFTVPDYSGSGAGEVVVQINQGETSREIAATLEQKNVVKSSEAFTQAARRDSRALSIQPGFYRLRSQMGAKEALGLILDPNSRILDRVTVPEGRRLSRALEILTDKTKIPESEFTAALKAPQDLGLPPYAKGKAEGFLFPETYDIDPGTSATSLLQEMTTRYTDVTESLGLVQGAKELGRTPLEVLTVASLVEAEARRPEDFGKVARVIYNRIEEGQRLQFDSTVHYAANVSGRVSTTAKERSNPSPYNTYVHKGLPPGPINSPGKRALEAALNPTPGDWMYFVTVNPDTGATKFARTYAEHERFVAEFQRWCRANADRC
ncbi:endolytic transglycosylase MltG [Actinopolymorpha alba]|uniref:endolytic transglycosylase MltG n=1 Tax=Actinopolymorpha alba TaxID=533267 RepID=UPI0003711730|nr:endolytic transglycosylase MltG [Actinopolymorpha alba]